jgi:hypothetical protein
MHLPLIRATLLTILGSLELDSSLVMFPVIGTHWIIQIRGLKDYSVSQDLGLVMTISKWKT